MYKLYRTSDIYLSAYLKTKGHNVIQIEKPNNQCFFCFNNDELLQSNKMRFFNNGLIAVTDYKNAIFDLKILIHNV